MARFSLKIISLISASLCFITADKAQAAMSPAGLWLTENERAVIEITPCSEGLCGYVHWIIDGGQQFDKHNPDPALRDDPICGMRILWGFEKSADNTWEGGRIYKADDGDLYKANLALENSDRLKLRGYVGLPLFGKTQYWSRANPDLYPQCRKP